MRKRGEAGAKSSWLSAAMRGGFIVQMSCCHWTVQLHGGLSRV